MARVNSSPTRSNFIIRDWRRAGVSPERRSVPFQSPYRSRSIAESWRRRSPRRCSSHGEILTESTATSKGPDPISETKKAPMLFSNKGQVVQIQNGVVKIEGIKNDAPLGTRLKFQNGEDGVLLWRHSGDCCFGIVFNEATASIQPGDSVVCAINSNSEKDKSISRNYAMYELCLDEIPMGKVLDSVKELESDGQCIPLLNSQLDMSSRQCINQPLLMQHKGVDILTPIGRGQCIIMASNDSQKLSDLAAHMIKAQGSDGSVISIYNCVGKTKTETSQFQTNFGNEDLIRNSVFVKSTQVDSLSDQFASICTSLCIGERIRDEGGDALVIIDSIKPLLEIWNEIQLSFIKDEAIDDLVEVDGTFMAAETAERRRFFSSILQRSSKASEALGGGSMTVIPVVKGRPATGHQELKIASIQEDSKIPETLKSKLISKLRSLENQHSNEGDSDRVPTYIIEELMSIADGQIVLDDEIKDGASLDPLLSVSRLGSRVYADGMERLTPQIRFLLAQAADAHHFDSEAITQASESWNAKIRLTKEALIQRSGDLCPLSSQLISLLALEHLQLDASDVQDQLQKVIARVEGLDPELIERINNSQKITEVQETRILELIRNCD